MIKQANTLETQLTEIAQAAVAATKKLALAPDTQKNTALTAIAAQIRQHSADIQTANAKDIAKAQADQQTTAFIDRLTLNEARIDAMATGLIAIAELADPVGRALATWQQPNGLQITRISVPLGVIGVIYESRPNVTADAAGLCLKSGNAVILRGGSDSFHSAQAIMRCITAGLIAANLPPECVQMVPTTDRAAVAALLQLDQYIDVIIPRGGLSLIKRVAAESRIPVFKHLAGICHTYVHQAADQAMATDIVLNAKMRRPGICGATETLLIDKAIAASYLPAMLKKLHQAGCAIRGDAKVMQLDPQATLASDEDWDSEYLDAVLAVKVVDDLDAAIAHINQHGSQHTEAIITADAKAAQRFLDEVNSAIVMHNTSTQFADGGEFGMGAEIGIATGKLHARGPVGVEQLTTFKYQVHGSGQVRG